MKTEKNSGRAVISSSLMLGLLAAAGIIIGSGNDLEIANAVYSPQDLFWRIITIAGMYPFYALWVFFVGVICRQVYCSELSRGKKTVLCIFCGYLGLSTSTICSWGMFYSDTIGAIFPQTIDSPPFIAAGALLGIYPLFFIGFFTSKKTFDGKLLGKMLIVCIVMLIMIYTMQGIKYIFCRPRYRLLIRDVPGVDFCPWYRKFEGAKELTDVYGIDPQDFRSFPSGHAIQCAGLLIAFPAVCDVYEALSDKKTLICAGSVMFTVMVCYSRMVMGAHFISDVSMGALFSVLFTFVEYSLEMRIIWKSGKHSKAYLPEMMN